MPSALIVFRVIALICFVAAIVWTWLAIFRPAFVAEGVGWRERREIIGAHDMSSAQWTAYWSLRAPALIGYMAFVYAALNGLLGWLPGAADSGIPALVSLFVGGFAMTLLNAHAVEEARKLRL